MGKQWPPTPGPGLKRMKPKGLGGGGIESLPNVNPGIGGKHGELVHQGDVDMAEGVL